MDPDVALRTLKEKLESLGIEAKTWSHPAIVTVTEHAAYLPPEGGRVKNLFLKSKRTDKLFLVAALVDTDVDLKTLQKKFQLGPKDILRFASEDLLIKHLGVREGAVTPFAIMNDVDKCVELLIDKRITECSEVHLHPLRNDATTTIRVTDLMKFFESLGRTPILF
eukprot:m51a1_g2369 putative dna-binding protein (166) ;mRNA; f:649718-650270